MKVYAPSKVDPVRTAQTRKKSIGGSGFAEALEEPKGVKAATGAQPVQTIGSLDGLLAAQSVDPDEERKRSFRTASDMLDGLEQVRRGILLGAIPVGRLQTLTRTLSHRMSVTEDAALLDVMQDILLRARVELAKVGIYHG